jgi:hypothetical protein
MPDDIFDHEIQPFLFTGTLANQQAPEFVVLGGQSGSGRSRTTGRLLEASPTSVVLSAASLTPFLTDRRETEKVREWMRDALAYARSNRVSLILEDPFQSAQNARAALDLFTAAGFKTRIVAVAVSRAESLLAAVARTERRGGTYLSSGESIRDDVDRGIQSQHELMSSPPPASEVTIVRRDGTFLEPAADPATKWQEVCDEPMPSRVAAEWISELRRITEIVVAQPGRSSRAVVEALVDLHRVAISEVVPAIPLPQNSVARDQLGERLRRDAAQLESIASRSSSPVGAQGSRPELDPGPALGG